MTRVDFYVLEQPTPRALDLVVCRLAEKAFQQGHQVHIRCASGQHAEALDEMLWTFHDTSFVPHAIAGSPEAAEVPVVIAEGDREPVAADVLINLHPEVAPFFSRFERVIETTGEDEAGRQAARARYRYYRDRGYAIHNHQLDGRQGG
ncbi:MAG: DNA polymerase III subunit chi [Gammaproteobacteria bacterium]|nr:DNA polymerase III subunit chi [Gammaproteobacteria bacterium]